MLGEGARAGDVWLGGVEVGGERGNGVLCRGPPLLRGWAVHPRLARAGGLGWRKRGWHPGSVNPMAYLLEVVTGSGLRQDRGEVYSWRGRAEVDESSLR